jgi:hypothetical protein
MKSSLIYDSPTMVSIIGVEKSFHDPKCCVWCPLDAVEEDLELQEIEKAKQLLMNTENYDILLPRYRTGSIIVHECCAGTFNTAYDQLIILRVYCNRYDDEPSLYCAQSR